MTPSQQASATWDAMTDEQRIAFLATEVMGWIFAEPHPDRELGFWYLKRRRPIKPVVKISRWNPLADWNAWRQVEKNVLKETYLLNEYIRVLVDEVCGDDLGKMSGIRCLVEADLPARAKALYIAYQSLHA